MAEDSPRSVATQGVGEMARRSGSVAGAGDRVAVRALSRPRPGAGVLWTFRGPYRAAPAATSEELHP